MLKLTSEESDKYIIRRDIIAFVILTLAAFAMHAIVLKFIFPGYYSPLYPHHSDFYVNVAIPNSSSYTFVGLLTYPRPLDMLTRGFSGFFGIHGSIVVVIAITCMNCALSALTVRRIFKLSFNISFLLLFCLYCYLVFSQPYFYTFYTHDVGSQLSFLFLILGAYIYYRTFDKSVFIAAFILFISGLLAFWSKEGYALTALWGAFLWFIYYRKESLIKGGIPFLAILLSIFTVFLFNLKIKSVFTNFEHTSDSPYSINLNPISVISQLFLYLDWGLNLANVIMSAILLYLALRYKNQRVFLYAIIGCFIALALSLIPNSLIPNHQHKGYSFNGTYLFYLPLLFLPVFGQPKMRLDFSFR